MLGMSREAVVTLCQTLAEEPPRPESTKPGQQKWDDLVQQATLAYETWHRWHCGSAALGDAAESVWCHNSSTLAGRRFINTVHGRIGIGPPDVRSGELGCVFRVGESVHVLRKFDYDTVRSSGIHPKEDLEAHSEHFSLVGDAYIPRLCVWRRLYDSKSWACPRICACIELGTR